MKKCSKCKEIKELNEFYKTVKKGSWCKKCKNEYHKIYISKNKDKQIKINKKYYSKPDVKELKKKKDLEYYYKTKSKHKAYKKEKYKREKEEILLKLKKYHSQPETKLKKKIYNKNNKEKIKIYRNKYYHINKNDPLFKLKNNITVTINRLLKLKNVEKNIRSLDLLGCSIIEFKKHLEQQFKLEMNWDNHGIVWEIDHIKPCSSFDLTKEEEQKKCFHYTNTQPLFKTTEIAEQNGYVGEIGNRNKINKL